MGFFSRKRKNDSQVTTESQGMESSLAPCDDVGVPSHGYADASMDFQALNDTVNSGISMVNHIADVYQRSKEIDRDIQQIQSTKEVELRKIAYQYELCRKVIEGTFGQRQEGLQAHYKVLDKALENDDRDMIVAALKGISSIVVTNPLESFSKFIEAWNDKSKPLELDF